MLLRRSYLGLVTLGSSLVALGGHNGEFLIESVGVKEREYVCMRVCQRGRVCVHVCRRVRFLCLPCGLIHSRICYCNPVCMHVY
jgi:hypothetical protein